MLLLSVVKVKKKEFRNLSHSVSVCLTEAQPLYQFGQCKYIALRKIEGWKIWGAEIVVL